MRKTNVVPIDRLKYQINTSKERKNKKLDLDSTKISKKKIKTYFGDNSDKILAMLESSNQDGALTLLKKNLLATVINALPHAEQILIESGTSKGTYQFATLISTIRELIADIQADQDKKFVSDAMLNNVIKPAYVDIAQSIVSKHFEFLSTSKEFIVTKHKKEFSAELRKLATDLAGDLKVSYKDVSAKITEQLKN